MKKLVFLILFAGAIHLKAQERISFQELGLSFEIPSGWTGKLQDEYYLLGHQTIPGLMILSQNSSTTAKGLKSLATRGIFEEGVELKPEGDFRLVGTNKVEGYYKGTFDGAEVKCFAVGLINSQGSGMNIMIVSTNELFSDIHVSEAKKLAGSVKFFESSDTQITTRWKETIVNRQLKYMYTNTSTDYSGGMSGISDETIIKLYPDGSFYYYSNSNSSFSSYSGFGYVDATKSNRGNYEIYSIGNDTYLELTFTDGKVYEYALTKSSEGRTLLNGSRYFVVDIDH